MWSKQYVGVSSIDIPLKNTDRLVQIGIEHLNSVPILEYENENIASSLPTFTVRIGEKNAAGNVVNTKDFIICDNDILEIPNLYATTMVVSFPKGVDKYTIIDVAIKDVDE